LLIGSATAPALAGDDGAAPLWEGLGSIVGLGNDKVQDPIDYRDRAKLVVPPKMTLPPPAASPTQGDATWPADPDMQRRKKEKAEAAAIIPLGPAKRPAPRMMPDPGTSVTMNATAGQGPAGRPCDAGPGDACQTHSGPKINWNPMTWVGLEKKPQVVLGPEPDRDWLTDPPKGYREPVEGAGVHIDQ
jgi:hypothetical protein